MLHSRKKPALAYHDSRSGGRSKLYIPIMFCLGLTGLIFLFASAGSENGAMSSVSSSSLAEMEANNPGFKGLVESAKILQPYLQFPKFSSSVSVVPRCTPEQAERQGKFKSAAKVRGCPPDDDAWMRLVHLLMPRASVFVDIGSNKGFSAARWLSLWNPELGLTPQILHQTIKQVTSNKEARECGACADCNGAEGSFMSLGLRLCGATSTKSSNGNYKKTLEQSVFAVCKNRQEGYKPIRVYSFDGNKGLVESVNAAIGQLSKFPPGKDQGFLVEFLPENPGELIRKAWSVELAAFTDSYYPGKTLTFIENGELGHVVTEDGREDDSAEKGGVKVEVPVLTVDQLVLREGISHIDFLKIDTEGHDIGVLEGSKETLRNKRATVVMFEYNEVWPVQYNGLDPLQAIVEDLAENDYICYLEGKNILIRISYCWSEYFSEKQWSNVWCACASNPIGSAIVSVFDSYSLAFN